MAKIEIRKASKEKAKLRMFISGPSGSGKTYTALKMASKFGKKICVIDTEFGSAEKYADEFEFDIIRLDQPTIEGYMDCLDAMADAGYDCGVIDSATHAWYAAQELVDDAAKRSRSQNTYMAWGEVTPKWNKFLRKIISMPFHVFCTARSKSEYVLDKDDRGRSTPRKLGMAAIIREGAEFEFDVAAEMDLQHNMIISKTRCKALDQGVYEKPDKEPAAKLLEWLNSGVEPLPMPEEKKAAPKPKAEEADPAGKQEFNDYVVPKVKSGQITGDFVRDILAECGSRYPEALETIKSKLEGADYVGDVLSGMMGKK